MEEPKRIYSLNLVAALLTEGLEYDKVAKDEKNQAYFVFPQSIKVAKAISEYKDNAKLQNYLRQFRKIKMIIKELQ